MGWLTYQGYWVGIPPVGSRPFFFPLFTGVRGIRILRSSLRQATPKQHQRYAIWGIRQCSRCLDTKGAIASRGGGLFPSSAPYKGIPGKEW